jgi:hypothetical protein
MTLCSPKPFSIGYNFHAYNDPGHGWLKVERSILFDYNLEGKISSYSYQNGEFVWLEEDCDAPKLLDAIKLKGHTVKIKDHYRNSESPIRKYEPYEAIPQI